MPISFTTTRLSLTARVRAYFLARPLTYIPSTDLARVGGRDAWRTRVSECRRQHGMTIENRCRRIVPEHREPYTISEYRWLPVQAGVQE